MLFLLSANSYVFAQSSIPIKNYAGKKEYSSVKGNVSVFSIPYFLNGRRIWIYLPPQYEINKSERYPVLYMQDGQNLFDSAESFAGEWEIDESCEKIFSQNDAEPFIIVAIDNAGTGRIYEYTPWPDLKYGGGGADEYLSALKNYLIPEINLRYRTKTGPENTFIGGSSLGGLLSAYAVFSYPETWGAALVMSPSYWWAEKRFLSWFSDIKKPKKVIFYQDTGSEEGGEESSEHLNNFREAEKKLLEKGFIKNFDFFSFEFSGHSHSEKFWALRFPQAVKILFPYKLKSP